MVVASRRVLLFLENMVFWIFKTSRISRNSIFANIWSNFLSQLQSFVDLEALASNYAGSFVESRALASNYAGSYVESRALASRGEGLGAVGPQEEVTAATATAAMVSQELSPFGQAPGPSRPGTKYPVRGIPHFDKLFCNDSGSILQLLEMDLKQGSMQKYIFGKSTLM